MDWKISAAPVPYNEAIAQMEARVEAIRSGSVPELVWLLEHPPLYTAGTSARREDLLEPRFPVFETGRGGQFTYHGPGQRVAYAMVDLKARQSVPDLRKYVFDLEEWIIGTLAGFGIRGERREGRIGIWVQSPEGEKKIAAIGVRVRRWVAYHGIALNVDPDLSHYAGIVPCGIREYGVTSMAQVLGKPVSFEKVDPVLQSMWGRVFEKDFLAA